MSANWDRALSAIDGWGADNAVAVVLGAEGILASRGDIDRSFRWASITKLVTALATLVAIDGGVLELTTPAGPPGSTLAHLLAHASGLDFDSETVLARPGTRRIYSNPAYDRIGALLAERDGTTFDQVIATRVLGPLGMTATELAGRPSEGLAGPAADLSAFARELLRTTLLRPATYGAMTEVAFPGLAGVLPGLGRYDPLDWGLGPELRDGKQPHWTGTLNSPGTFGHFGGAGTFLWIDPALDIALVCLTDRSFDAWALDAWPAFSDAVIRVATSIGDADEAAAR